MIKTEIEILKTKLDQMISEGMDYSEIYQVSVSLDELIVRYYLDKKKYATVSAQK